MINAKEAAEMLKNMSPENKVESLEKRISASVLSKLDNAVKLAIANYKNHVHLCLIEKDVILDPAIKSYLKLLDPDDHSYRVDEKDIKKYLSALDYLNIEAKAHYL